MEHFVKTLMEGRTTDGPDNTQQSPKMPCQQTHATSLLADGRAYFVTAMSLQKEDPEVEKMRSAIPSLLAIVSPQSAPPRTQYTATLSVITTILAPQPSPSAPPIKETCSGSCTKYRLERLVRRLGSDDIVAFFPGANEKLLVNIMKRRERAKRKKANKPEVEINGEADDEREETTKKSSKKQGADAWIKEDDDTPLDPLDRRVVSRVTASHPSMQAARKVKNLSSVFKTSDSKPVIEESDTLMEQARTLRRRWARRLWT
ncbi:MAG: hypothetical protein J3Q66DRAFT_400905 [Benniella sp.]|nr:MAG: hypothetical protein J3Q66DRAFT_400905 [Benniella sp.]